MSEERRTYKDFNLRIGVYWIYWKGGGRSVASVGQDQAGRYWYAPANWLSVPWLDWSKVERVELIQENTFD